MSWQDGSYDASRVFPGVSDGAPSGPYAGVSPVTPALEAQSPQIPDGHVPMSRGERLKSRLVFEGPRGASTRAAVYLRYLAYFLVIVLGSGIAAACFSGVSGAGTAGAWMLLSASFQLLTAAVGSFAFPARRPEISQQVRSYVFGYTIFPGIGVAVFMWAANHISAGPTGSDQFVVTLKAALPWLYFLPIILPAVIFMKSVAGMRILHREQQDDQEIMNIYTRNDGLQR